MLKVNALFMVLFCSMLFCSLCLCCWSEANPSRRTLVLSNADVVRGSYATFHSFASVNSRYGMDCSTDEYYHSGQCHKCPKCSPGQELKEDCGYGVGVSAVCGMCDFRWFKEDWGSHPCTLCQNCRRLNRHQIKHCTHTENAVCGNCLPGFYSKMRLDGLEDLECLPCGPAPFRNIMCSRGEGIGVEKVQTSAPPIQNASSIVTACAATAVLTTVLFAILCVTYQTRSSLRKTCKRCLSPVSNSHHDTDAVSVPMPALHTVMQNTEVDISNPCLPLKDPCMLDDITTMVTSDLGLHECEFLPLMRSSACTDPAMGVIMQATETHDVSSLDPALILTLDGGQSTVRPCCAVEQQTAWGFHAPVECTELDIQHLSIASEIQTFRTSEFIARNISQCMGSDSTLTSDLMLRDLERERREGGKGDC